MMEIAGWALLATLIHVPLFYTALWLGRKGDRWMQVIRRVGLVIMWVCGVFALIMAVIN